MNAMLVIGNDKETIKNAADAIVSVLKAAGTEASSVAAMNTLAELARAPAHTTISYCTFTTQPEKRKRTKG